MHVRIVCMRVHQRRMDVWVTVRFAAVPSSLVGVLMVFVMRVDVCVLLLLVCVQMTVMFGEMQPDTARHEQAGRDELPRNGVALNQYR